MKFAGQERGKNAMFQKAAAHDIYPGSVVYTRHHSNYIKCKVVCPIWGAGLIKIQMPLAAPEALISAKFSELFVKVN